MTSVEFFLAIALISASAFLSASEVALFSLSRFQVRILKDTFRQAHTRIKSLLNDPDGVLITILVTNEIVNISLSNLMVGVIARKWAAAEDWIVRTLPLPLTSIFPQWSWQTFCVILVTTPLLLIFCEVTPKSIGTRLNQLIAPLTASGLFSVYLFFKPIRISLMLLLRLFNPKKRSISTATPMDERLKESEFLFMVEQGQREGMLQDTEADLIRKVFEFDDTNVSEIATPLVKVASVEENEPIQNIERIYLSKRYSRIPVYRGNRKRIVGIVYVKDLLFLTPEERSKPLCAADVMREPYVIPSKMKLNTLFSRMKSTRTHMAVISDDQDATGLVTLHDVLEDLFEDLFPENMNPAAEVRK